MKWVFLLLLLVCCLLIAPAAAAGGSGTAADPYIIQTPVEFQSIQNDLSAHYKLGNDLDFTGFTFQVLGSNTAPFFGSLDGSGHTISNIMAFGSNRVGIFATTNAASISNIVVKDSIFVGTEGYVGSITGYPRDGFICDNVVIENCIIKGDDNVGGIAGPGYSGTYTFNDCIVHYTTIQGDGGVAGFCPMSTTGGIIVDNANIEKSCIMGAGNVGAICITTGTQSIINSKIQDINIYGSSIIIYPPNADSSNTASGITNVADRYLYASGLTATQNGKTVSYTVDGRQGSTTVEAAQGTAQSWAWTFGDGQTSTAAQDTTHTYAAPGTYSTSLTLKNYLDSTGITVTTSGYNILPIPPTVSASANVLQLGQSVTLNAAGTLFSTIQWQYSTDSGATWQDISGATTATYEWTPTAGVYQVRAHVTAVGTGFTADSNVLAVSVYAPPTITAVSVSPTIGQYTQTITLSAEVSGATTYQWQQSPEGQNTWTNISGATTAQWIGQLTFAGATDFRLIATGTGGQTISETVTYYIALPGEIQSLTATPSVVALPGSTTLSATGSNVITWEWQELISGTWTTIGYGASLQESLTTEGTYTYRVLATGADGTTITSETVEVLAGYAPSVSITSPAKIPQATKTL